MLQGKTRIIVLVTLVVGFTGGFILRPVIMPPANKTVAVGAARRTNRASAQLPRKRLRRSAASTLMSASSAFVHSPPRTEPSRQPATT